MPFSVSAQGTAADYERMEKYAKGLEECHQPDVNAHWLPSNEEFWYRKFDPKESFEFLYVSAAQRVRRAAFDHVRLAQALSAKNIPATASALPFAWISLTANASAVRFIAGNSKWNFDSNGTLTPYSASLEEEKLVPIKDMMNAYSIGGGVPRPARITFVNRSNKTVALRWFNLNKAMSPPSAMLEPGQLKTINTLADYVWRVQESTGQIIASFRAIVGEAQAVIEDPSPSINRRNKVDKSVSNEKESDGLSIQFDERQTPILNINLADDRFSSNDSSRIRIVNSIGDFPSKFPDGKVTKWYPSSVTEFTVVYDTTPEQLHPVYMVESSPKNQTQPLLRMLKDISKEEYLKPGDKVKMDRPRLYRNSEEIETDNDLFKNPWTIADMGWNAEGTEYRFLYNERGHRIMRIIGIKLDGTVRVIREESSKTFINYSSKLYAFGLSKTPGNDSSWIKAGDAAGRDEFIWASEMSGWNHLYLLDMRSGSIKPITQGEWAMRKVERVDEVNRQIWFQAFGLVAGQDYYYAHLARINFDGTGLKVFTADVDATHAYESPPPYDFSGKYFLNAYSRVDTPVKTVVRSAVTGDAILDLEEGSLECYRSAGWTVPERFTAKGRDGKTDIYGIIVKPSNFDPNKKYPVLEQLYAGPQDFYVPKAFEKMIRQHEYAELGFIVVQIDGMGTNWRSKAFHDVCHKNLKDAGFLDRIAWMKQAQETRPWMDLSRVGTYGISAGGQNAMAALLFHPEFYKAAAADSGCHDNRMDKIWWNEQWMGWPVDQSYIDSSNVVNAHKLEGALMLLVPELDSNVDAASTMQVVDALTRANKEHELIVLPEMDHGAGTGTVYGLRKQRDFFVRELLGVQPPKRNGRGNSSEDGFFRRGF